MKRNPASRIQFPNEEKMKYFADMVKAREPLINNVIGFVDGFTLACRCSDDELMQNAAYNGYNHDTSCNNVFAFHQKAKLYFQPIIILDHGMIVQ